jgi:hypothetical protein
LAVRLDVIRHKIEIVDKLVAKCNGTQLQTKTSENTIQKKLNLVIGYLFEVLPCLSTLQKIITKNYWCIAVKRAMFGKTVGQTIDFGITKKRRHIPYDLNNFYCNSISQKLSHPNPKKAINEINIRLHHIFLLQHHILNTIWQPSS